MTNGDRIRQMSNEELARTMVHDCDYCMQGEYCETSCVEGIKAYLENEEEQMTIQENVIFDNPALSDGQKKRLRKILKHCDINEMVAYFYKKFPDGDFENMTKTQAAKLVTGLDYKIPAPIIRGVVGRYD